MKPLIILTGPTAVGKTALSISLAKAVGGEIISADSMQVYRHMDIGSAKIRPEEMDGVPHHLIDVLEPWEEFHVVRFQQLVKEAMAGIQAIVKDIDFTENGEDSSYRENLERRAREEGCEALHRELAAVDPESAAQIHPNNVKRIIRALEYYEQTGQPIFAHNEEQKEKPSPYNYAYFVLTDDREVLYERIDRRVDQMLSDGLVEEVKRLREMGCSRELVSMQGLGYKEILAYLEGEMSLDEAVYVLKRDTRHFAKRQLTWFRREKEVIWLDKREFDRQEERILEKMLDICHAKNILPISEISNSMNTDCMTGDKQSFKS